MMIFKTIASALILATSGLAAVSAGEAWSSGSSAGARANVGATVLPPIQVSSNGHSAFVYHPHYFGHPGSTSGLVNHNNSPLRHNPNLPMKTELTISGEPKTAYSVSLPSQGLINVTNGKRVLFLDGVLSSDRTSGTLDEFGRQTLNIQAVFNMLNNKTISGHYRGNFSVTVEHN